MKRMIALILCFVLLMAALPGSVLAASSRYNREGVTIQRIEAIYQKCLAAAEKENFSGLCGLMTSMQLWQMGINSYLTDTGNGNQQFDAYANMGVTSGGYYITAYSAEDYSLEKALNIITRNGTRDAENILVGFESTNTELGGTYGHACVIHAIIDGKVYFLENYATYCGPEGTVNCMTIGEFVRFYEDWTVFEGVIHFGRRVYADSCQSFPTDVFVRTRFGSNLRSEPCLLSENDCIRLRSIAAGETLHATAVMMNDQGEYYYRIEEGDRFGYVAATAVSVVQANPEALEVSDLEIPTEMKEGETIALSGTVTAISSAISAMRVEVVDKTGKVMLEAKLDVEGCTCDLQDLNEQLDLSSLKQGIYDVCVYVTSAGVTVKGTGLGNAYDERLMHRQELNVGNAPQSRAVTQEPEQPVKDGWCYENGTWYFYRDNKPCSGWLCYLGIDYYLQEDGSVTTGWAEIEGWMRYFTATGAMCIGWLETQEGTRYWQEDGTEAVGLQEIDGKRYYFREDFILATGGTVTDGDVTYEVQADGTVVEVTDPEKKEN